MPLCPEPTPRGVVIVEVVVGDPWVVGFVEGIMANEEDKVAVEVGATTVAILSL